MSSAAPSNTSWSDCECKYVALPFLKAGPMGGAVRPHLQESGGDVMPLRDGEAREEDEDVEEYEEGGIQSENCE
eukprot:222192-Karenia_brevis.AAC.1